MLTHLRDVAELLLLMAVTLVARLVRLAMLVPLFLAWVGQAAAWAMLLAMHPAYQWVDDLAQLVPFQGLWRLYRREGWVGVRARRRPLGSPPS